MSLKQRAQGAGRNASMRFWQRAAGAAPAKMVVQSYQNSTSSYHSLPRTLAPQAIFAGGKPLPSSEVQGDTNFADKMTSTISDSCD
jgi:hypothetical protein